MAYYFLCLKGNYRPDMIIITEGLLMCYGEETREHMECQALDDAIMKFQYGLSFYGSIPYLFLYTASGNLVHFHLLYADGSVSNHMLRILCEIHASMLVSDICVYRLQTAQGRTICSWSTTGQPVC